MKTYMQQEAKEWWKKPKEFDRGVYRVVVSILALLFFTVALFILKADFVIAAFICFMLSIYCACMAIWYFQKPKKK